MRSLLVVWFALGSLPGRADTRRAIDQVIVRARPGEKAPAIATLAAGAAVEVMREEGRWLVVRVEGKDGYVTRTTVTEPDKVTPRTSAWSAKRRVGGAADGAIVDALFVTVRTPTARLRTGKSPTAPELATAVRGTKLAVISAGEGAWIEVRDDQQRVGFIARADVATSAALDTALDAAPRNPPTPAVRGSKTGLVLAAEGGVGLRIVGMDLSSNGQGGLTNYLVDADAVAATFAASAAIQRPRWRVVADLDTLASQGIPGIEYPGPTSTAGTIPFRTVSAELGVSVLRRTRALAFGVRVAGHYDAFVTSVVDNVGSLPREHLIGAVGGLRLELAPPASRFAATLRADALLTGVRGQTRGLEDGTSSKVRGTWSGAQFHYALTPRWRMFGSFDFTRVRTEWTGMSNRQVGVTSTRRIDTSQLTRFGVEARL